MIWKPIPESVLLIIQFPHDFVIPFPLHHSHFCNTSFSTYWNPSPPPLTSHSLSHLRILFGAAQHLQRIPHPTAGRTPGAGKFGCRCEIPALSVQSSLDSHGGGCTFAPFIAVSSHPCGVLSPPKAGKSRTLIREMLGGAGMWLLRWMSPGSAGRGAGGVQISMCRSSVWSLGTPRTQTRGGRQGGWRWITTGYQTSRSHQTFFHYIFARVFFADATRSRSVISCGVSSRTTGNLLKRANFLLFLCNKHMSLAFPSARALLTPRQWLECGSSDYGLILPTLYSYIKFDSPCSVLPIQKSWEAMS